jgi:hypothetical protein
MAAISLAAMLQDSARVFIHTPLMVTNCQSSVSDSTMPSGSCRLQASLKRASI